jgi:hypothetical protein
LLLFNKRQKKNKIVIIPEKKETIAAPKREGQKSLQLPN